MKKAYQCLKTDEVTRIDVTYEGDGCQISLPNAVLSEKCGVSANIRSATRVAQDPTGSMVHLKGHSGAIRD